ncbi:hypothetical protein [Rhodobium gokarnense]|uniref:Uncharacterized protein n=1 Tax=Rhodobium gokarnense TaxID=364296 RepID=A0ABT3HH71_9HYPH|nr:hypothetical protein [Rhodobium gokarnense]MCW2309689.1 hypothetical protein [Rhodobium gokarnense]
MSAFDNVTACRLTNAHGEVNFIRIDEGTVDTDGFALVGPGPDGFIVGHSESGHHHVLEAGGATVMEFQDAGMKMLYAILGKPAVLKQSAGDPHEEQVVEPGAYLITNNQEYNPFTEQARRVAD